MILSRLIPLAAFLGLGAFLRWRSLLSVNTVDQIKWLIVHVLLPGVLFKTFLIAHLEPALAVVAGAVFGANVIMYGLGFLLGRGLRQGARYAPFLTSGMEYGMLGLALFASLYGMAKVEYIAVVDLAVWVLFLASPSFSVPVFARPRDPGEQSYITSTIAVYTLITFAAAFVILGLQPTLG